MLMEEKLLINELEQGKELANRLMKNLMKIPSSSSSSSKESNSCLISEILRSYENAIVLLSLDKKVTKRRSQERMDHQSNNKKRRTLEKKKKTEEVKICVETSSSLDDGYSWRKYGQKDIHGSKNPRGYYRCTHRFTRGCQATKQVQKSDTDALCYRVKYLENHTCNITPSNTKYSVSLSKEEKNRGYKLHDDTEESKDMIKQIKSEECMLSLDDLDDKKEIFRTFSFSNPETENFSEWINLMEDLSPTTSESGITNELLTTSSVSVVNSPTVDSCFSSLDNIFDFSYDWSLMQ